MEKATPQASLAYQALTNLNNFKDEYTDKVYDMLVKVIKDVSSRGAIGLDIRHHSDYTATSAVTIRENSANIWHIDCADVDINIAPVVYHREIANRLEADGFLVSYVTNADYGTIIDRVVWADE
jgi:hypothetical protein|nr:MAG TPA: hypothetical protein [Caudoviricetes sp.]